MSYENPSFPLPFPSCFYQNKNLSRTLIIPNFLKNENPQQILKIMCVSSIFLRQSVPLTKW